jgi:mono/diheme cytochrome c family protein
LIADVPEKLKADKQALIQGVADAVAPDPKSKTPKRKLRLAKEPAGLAALHKSTDKKIASLATTIDAGLTWPSKPGDTTPPLKPLTSEQQERFATGGVLYNQLCGVCHQPSGMGQDGLAPALLDSEWVLGTPARTTRIILQGVEGPIKVGKKTFEGEMPGLQALPDDQIAAILTYIRREWGHEADPVEPAYVAKIRKETAGRGEQQWTAEELMNVK